MEPQNFRHYDRVNHVWQQTEIPTNLPRRPKELNSSGKPIAIRVNQFKVVQWPQKDAHQYDVSSH